MATDDVTFRRNNSAIFLAMPFVCTFLVSFDANCSCLIEIWRLIWVSSEAIQWAKLFQAVLHWIYDEGPSFSNFEPLTRHVFAFLQKSYPIHPTPPDFRELASGVWRVGSGLPGHQNQNGFLDQASPLFRMRKTTTAVFFKQPFENILNEALFGFLIILFKANLKEV